MPESNHLNEVRDGCLGKKNNQQFCKGMADAPDAPDATAARKHISVSVAYLRIFNQLGKCTFPISKFNSSELRLAVWSEFRKPP